MHPLLQLGISLLILLLCIAAIALIVGIKLESLLRSLNRVVKLEIRDPIGRISLAGTILIAALFLTCFISGEAMWLVSTFLKPEQTPHLLNLDVWFVTVAFAFIGDLIVLYLLKLAGRRKSTSRNDSARNSSGPTS